jgi:hypothetical protein
MYKLGIGGWRRKSKEKNDVLEVKVEAYALPKDRATPPLARTERTRQA